MQRYTIYSYIIILKDVGVLLLSNINYLKKNPGTVNLYRYIPFVSTVFEEISNEKLRY